MFVLVALDLLTRNGYGPIDTDVGFVLHAMLLNQSLAVVDPKGGSRRKLFFISILTGYKS